MDNARVIAMSQWKCPACDAFIRYQDYDRIRTSDEPYPCHKCGIALIVDKTTDELILASRLTPKPPRPKRR